MGYNGLAYGLDSLAGDPYINNIISGLTEYASYAAAFLCIPGGRKKIYVILLFIGGVALIANAAIQDIYQSESGMFISPFSTLLSVVCIFNPRPIFLIDSFLKYRVIFSYCPSLLGVQTRTTVNPKLIAK